MKKNNMKKLAAAGMMTAAVMMMTTGVNAEEAAVQHIQFLAEAQIIPAVGEEFDAAALLDIEGGSENTEVLYSVYDEAVAEISEDGVLTVAGYGVTTVIAYLAEDETVCASMDVAVVDFYGTYSGEKFIEAMSCDILVDITLQEDGTYTATAGGSTAPDETETDESESETPEETETEMPNETAAVQTGVYSGTYATTAMGSTVTYYCTLTVNADDTYAYTVEFNMMNNDYQQTESGTYAAEENSLTLTRSDGYVMGGTINEDGTLSVTRKVSSFASAEVTINFTYGTNAVLLASVPETAVLQSSEKKEQTEAATEEITEADTEAATEEITEMDTEAVSELTTETATEPKSTVETEIETESEETSAEPSTEMTTGEETETETMKDETSAETETETKTEESSSETERETQKETVTEKASETVTETTTDAQTGDEEEGQNK